MSTSTGRAAAASAPGRRITSCCRLATTGRSTPTARESAAPQGPAAFTTVEVAMSPPLVRTPEIRPPVSVKPDTVVSWRISTPSSRARAA